METNTNIETPERADLLARLRTAAEIAASVCSFLGVAGFLVAPAGFLRVAGAMLAAGGFFLPKLILAALLVRHYKPVFFVLRRFYRFLRTRAKTERLEARVEGVPKSELLHFLFETGAFKLDDFRRRFGLHRRVHERIARRLEKLGVLVRGENNSRVLAVNDEGSPKFSLQEIKTALDGADTAGDISLFQIAGRVRTAAEIRADLAAMENPLFKIKAVR